MFEFPRKINMRLADVDFTGFSLTGSRRFGNHRPDSDWDYYTDDPKLLSAMVAWIGENSTSTIFQRTRSYGVRFSRFDAQTKTVYEVQLEDAKLHLILVESAKIKAAAENIIEKLELYKLKEPDKIQRAWNWAYHGALLT